MELILLAGHGSPKKDANSLELIAKMLHEKIHPECTDQCVRVAYMEFAEPNIPQGIDNCVKDGADKVIIHPFFLSNGVHVTKDIPGMIDEARERHPGCEFIYTEPLGIHNKMIELVVERINAATGLKPQEIEERSFEIIADETDLSDVPDEQKPIMKRVIHTTADFEYKSSLEFHPDAVKAGIEAIKAGKDILTDVEMVKTGINKKLLDKWGGKVICNISNVEITDDNDKRTRSELGIEKALKENDNIGIIAIGNAPTALLKTIDLVNSELNITVVGVPVGFVKAIESKTLLAKQEFPYITNISRKGGSPIAAAIVNALLKMADESS